MKSRLSSYRSVLKKKTKDFVQGRFALKVDSDNYVDWLLDSVKLPYVYPGEHVQRASRYFLYEPISNIPCTSR